MSKTITLNNVYINSMAISLPNEPVNNDEMEQVLGQVGPRPSRARSIILKSNGIKNRYYAIDPKTRKATHNNATLAASAVDKLFKSDARFDEITALSCGTSYPDQIMPGHGVMVHGALKESVPYEVYSASGVCVAGVAALKYAYQLVQTGEHKKVIASASECPSGILRSENFAGEIESKVDLLEKRPEIAFEKDFLRWMLSDGAGAFYLTDRANEKGLSLKINWIDICSFANEIPTCMYAGGEYEEDVFKSWMAFSQSEQAQKSVMSIKQNVKLLNEKIIEYTVEKMLIRSIAKHQLRVEDIDYFLPHYSSLYFRERVYAGLKNINFEIPYEKWFTNLETKGNTGAASIYIMLEEFTRTTSLTHGQKILCYIPESGRFSSAFMLLEVVNGD